MSFIKNDSPEKFYSQKALSPILSLLKKTHFYLSKHPAAAPTKNGGKSANFFYVYIKITLFWTTKQPILGNYKKTHLLKIIKLQNIWIMYKNTY